MFQYMVNAPMDFRLKLVHLYWHETWKGELRRFFACLLRRDCKLETLCIACAGQTDLARTYVGIKDVPLRRICGSEDQAPAFDRCFHPIGERPRPRWLSIAEARYQGKPLPPVQLTEWDGRYYVRDGHHRVSVARALGEAYIEAEVVRIQMGDLR